MTTSRSAFLGLVLSFAASTGCSSTPPPLAPAAAPASLPGGARGESQPPDPEAAPRLATAAAAPAHDPCLVARIEGTVGNCIAPSLVIQDTCEDRRYVVHFDDCSASHDIDLTGLALRDTHVLGAYVADGHPTPPVPQVDRHAVTAIRGTIVGGHGELGGTTFDIEIDHVRGGVKQTRHLEGVTEPRVFATNQ